MHSNSAMTLADFTSSELVVSPLQAQDAAGVIRELSLQLARAGRIPDLQSFWQAVMKRESVVSTNMEANMAFPHGRLPGSELSFALGRSPEPIAWDTSANGPVRLVFVTAVPENDQAAHLRLIAGLARLARDPMLVKEMLAEQDAARLYGLLQRVKLSAGPAGQLATKSLSPNLSR
jgi:mannitol/fructose-specific phosphotransferase system IIA component (Ntr-type)